jgi:phosphoglycolate phosphatase
VRGCPGPRPNFMLTLFWDIDGTLISTAGAGRAAWCEAAGDVSTQFVDFATLPIAGLTDIQIADLVAGTIDPHHRAQLAPVILARYESLLAMHLPRTTGRVLPNVRAILEHLRGRDDVMSLVLTGNTRAGALTKLSYYGLGHYFPAGAFSDGTVNRAEVASRAVAAAAALLGGRFQIERAIVIGDTPHDIHCAHAVGIRALAVASHVFSAAELAAHAPWAVLEGLPEPAAFVARLGLEPIEAAVRAEA